MPISGRIIQVFLQVAEELRCSLHFIKNGPRTRIAEEHAGVILGHTAIIEALKRNIGVVRKQFPYRCRLAALTRADKG